MIFKTTILDNSGKEWNFTGEVVGAGMYSDSGDKSGLCIENFGIEFIELKKGDEKISVRNLAVMPDQFRQADIKELEKEGERLFLQAWMDVQDCAHDLNN